MDEFQLYSIDNKNIILKLSEVTMNGFLFKVKVEELRKETSVLFKDVIATIAFMSETNKVVLSFECEPKNKLLDITNNQAVIDYIYENSDSGIRRNTDLYYYSSAYKDDYED